MVRFLFIVALLAMPTEASPVDIYVPDDYPKIQLAIDASLEGDTILVRTGVYKENLDFKGKAVTVRNAEESSSAIIDAGGKGSAVSFNSGEGPGSILDGFIIRNGDTSYGGGICCIDSSPTLMNNEIRSNFSNWGGGISCRNSSPAIQNNIITANEAVYGGGIYCTAHSNPLILENRFFNNESSTGGGICCDFDASPMIVKNEIEQNTASHGGGISCNMFCSPMIERNSIHHNTGLYNGGGILCDGNSDPEIVGNNIFGNHALFSSSPLHGAGICCRAYASPIIRSNVIYLNDSGPGAGGGIFVTEDAHPVIENNMICGNVGSTYGGGICFLGGYPFQAVTNNTIYRNVADHIGGGIVCGPDMELDITNTIIWGNESGMGGESIHVVCDEFHPTVLNIGYSDIGALQTSIHLDLGGSINWGSGVIDTDPLFVDPQKSDFHLTYDSPCRDTADNGAVIEFIDFEGDPRIAWDGTVDMGADEFYNHLYFTGDKTPGGSIEGKIVGMPGANPVGLLVGSGVIETPLPTAWGNFWLESPWCLIPLPPIPADGVMVLPATVPPSPLAPYDLPMQALIGLNSDSLTNLEALDIR